MMAKFEVLNLISMGRKKYFLVLEFLLVVSISNDDFAKLIGARKS